MCVCIIMRDKVANEGFRVMDYLQTKHKNKA